jgi:co-chaperonin GroES (HSP10)
VRNNIIYSFGRTVIVKRDVAKKITDGGIEIPENRRTQSLTGEVIRLGISTKPFRVNGIKPGMKVRLKEWEAHMIELELEDGSFGLIVKETDILYYEY